MYVYRYTNSFDTHLTFSVMCARSILDTRTIEVKFKFQYKRAHCIKQTIQINKKKIRVPQKLGIG